MNQREKLSQVVDLREAAVRNLTAVQILLMGCRGQGAQVTADVDVLSDIEDSARFVLARARRLRKELAGVVN